MTIEQILAKEFNLKPEQIIATLALIDDGNTIPFIACRCIIKMQPPIL